MHKQPTKNNAFNGKKGVSPLIATILLLAFAVALATVIFQLDFDSCSNSTVRYSIRNGQPRVCYEKASKSVLAFVSSEETYVSGFKAIIEGENDVMYKSINLTMRPNMIKKITIPYDKGYYGNIVSFRLIPKVKLGNEKRECPIHTISGPLDKC